MISRFLFSEWLAIPLTLAMIVCVSSSVHSDRGPTPTEQLFAYGSMGMFWAWLIACGYRARRQKYRRKEGSPLTP
jgi:hypothetical protein